MGVVPYPGAMRIRPTAAALAAVSLSLVIAACSNGSSSPTTSASTSTAAPTSSSAPAAPTWIVNDCATGQPTPAETTDLPPLAGVEGIAVSQGEGAPTVAVSTSSAPATDLVSVDLVEGTGKAVPATGATVTVQYCGVGQATRTYFDASWARGEPATFPLSGVIAGWTEGIPGMKPGGRRVLVIPGDLAYGPDGRPPVILPDETLIFVVELLEWSS